MTAPSGREVAPGTASGSSGSEPMPRATGLALSIACAGHLLVLIAAATDPVPPDTAIAVALACSILHLAAWTELAPPDARARRIVAALAGGQGVAAAPLLAGLLPGVPWPIPLAGVAAAAALGGVCVAAVRRGSMVNRPPQPLTLAPRV